MKPDLSWWPSGTAGSQPIFVGDAKYKKLEPERFRERRHLPDARLLHRADLPSGLLVYAGKGESSAHKIKHADRTIEVASLDLAGTPEAILDESSRGRRTAPAGRSLGGHGELNHRLVEHRPTHQTLAPSSRLGRGYRPPAGDCETAAKVAERMSMSTPAHGALPERMDTGLGERRSSGFRNGSRWNG